MIWNAGAKKTEESNFVGLATERTETQSFFSQKLGSRKQDQGSAAIEACIMSEFKKRLRSVFHDEDRALRHQYLDFSGRAGLVLAGSQHPARQFHDREPAVGNQWRNCHGDRRRVVLVRATQALMADQFRMGDQVEVYLDARFGAKEGWYAGKIFRIDPYSEHRSFYWVRFDEAAQKALNLPQISVFNPKNVRKTEQGA
jgi:hypothetical protein